MLTRLLRRAAAAAAAAMALVCLAQVPALAGGGPGTAFGFAQCGQSSSAQCAVTAGTGPAPGTPGSRGTPAAQPAAQPRFPREARRPAAARER